MKFKSNVINIGTSTYLLLPKEIVEFLQLRTGQETVVLEDNEKSKGKFVAFWSNEQKKKDVEAML